MQDYREKQKYYPTLVSNVHGQKKSGEGRMRIQKLHALPQKTQDILNSDDIIDFIYGVEQRFRLNDVQTEEFSRLVRRFFFREVTETTFSKQVANICKISPDEALKLLRTIQKIDPSRSAQEAQKKNIVKMSLNEAIAKYPSILDQIITKKAITSKPFLKSLKPTIKNWIMVYEKVLDVSKHDALERGKFIFSSEATKNISDEEKRRLSLILKSRDEDSNLMINAENGQLVFAVKKEQKAPELQKKPISKDPQQKDIQQQNFAHAQNMQKVTSPIIQKNFVQNGKNDELQVRTFPQQVTNPVMTTSPGQKTAENPEKEKTALAQKKSFDMIRPIPLITDVQNQKDVKDVSEKNVIDEKDIRSEKDVTVSAQGMSIDGSGEKLNSGATIQKKSVNVSESIVGEDSVIEKDTNGGEKGFFGTSSYLSGRVKMYAKNNDKEIVDKKMVGSAMNGTIISSTENISEEAKRGFARNPEIEEKNIKNEKETKERKSVSRDEVLQSTAGEIEYFVKNVVKRKPVQVASSVITSENKPVEISIEEQDVIDEKIGKKRKKRKIGVTQKKIKKDKDEKLSFPTTSGKVLIEKENVDVKIAQEEEELRKATEKMNKLINEMQKNVTAPRNIGEEVKTKKRVSLQEEHGDIEEEIKKNRKELYGEFEEESLLELEQELEETSNEKEEGFKDEKKEQNQGSKDNTGNTSKKQQKNIEENNKNVEEAMDGTITFEDREDVVLEKEVKKDESGGNIVFSSNHLLPSEKEKGDVQNTTKNSFNITPIGREHGSE